MDTSEEKPTLPGLPTLSAVLAKAAAARQARIAFNKATLANTATAKEDRAAELSVDGLNDDRYGQTTSRSVIHTPPVAGTRATADVGNVTHIPISKPTVAQPIEATVPVVRDNSIAAQTRRDISALERGAASDARREGSYASTVVAAFPSAAVDASEVPAQGLVTRVVQAKLAAETGAAAADCPNVPGWDVRVGAVAEAQSILRRIGHYDVLVIPPSMPKGASEALASLVLPGGAGAYGWRYNQPQYDTLMPSYVRLKYPGGRAKVLVLYEQPEGRYVFGGASLNPTNLDALELWMRRQYGNELVDQAYKTMTAAGHVYLNPDDSDKDLGHNVGSVQATTTAGGTDYAGLQWLNYRALDTVPIPRVPEVDNTRRPPGFDQALWDAFRATEAAPPGVNAQLASVRVNEQTRQVMFTWRAGNATQTRYALLDAQLDWLLNEANGQPDATRMFAGAWRTQDQTLYELSDPDQRSDSDTERTGVRNVFSFDDKATLALPVFDLSRLGPFIAGVLVMSTVQRSASNVERQGLRDRLRSYAAKLHVAHLFTAVEQGIWPDVLDEQAVDHGMLVASLPPDIQPLCYVVDASRSLLAAANWQMLESTLRLKGTTKRTAYVGYDVPGTWVVGENGHVAVNDDKTVYAALDAALRVTWNYGGTVAATDAGCVGVVDLYGYVAPLAVAPAVRVARRLRGIGLEAGTGADSIGYGSNAGFDFVRAL